MTTELQDQLDAASIVVADGKGGFYAMLHKSDVEEIFDKLTGWTKVEDGLPDVDVLVLLKFKLTNDNGITLGRYDGKAFYCAYDNQFVTMKVTEWKSII